MNMSPEEYVRTVSFIEAESALAVALERLRQAPSPRNRTRYSSALKLYNLKAERLGQPTYAFRDLAKRCGRRSEQ